MVEALAPHRLKPLVQEVAQESPHHEEHENEVVDEASLVHWRGNAVNHLPHIQFPGGAQRQAKDKSLQILSRLIFTKLLEPLPCDDEYWVEAASVSAGDPRCEENGDIHDDGDAAAHAEEGPTLQLVWTSGRVREEVERVARQG